MTDEKNCSGVRVRESVLSVPQWRKVIRYMFVLDMAWIELDWFMVVLRGKKKVDSTRLWLSGEDPQEASLGWTLLETCMTDAVFFVGYTTPNQVSSQS